MGTPSSFRRQCQERNDPCWICLGEIDYSIPATGHHRDLSFSLDHYWPRSMRPDLRNTRSNWRPSHALCNNRRQSRLPKHTFWVGDMMTGKWFDESDEHAAKRIKREAAKRNKPILKPTINHDSTAPLVWSERWGSG